MPDTDYLTAVSSNDLIKKPRNVSCTVCNADNAQLHYGALCCVSCKMFFRRNSEFDLKQNGCVFNSECDITINSRRACRYCRMKKCFEVGMQRELLRARHQCQGTRQQQQQPQNILPIPCSSSTPALLPTRDLLRNDRSLLSTEQWSYISNMINTYNTLAPTMEMRRLLTEQASFPMKLRLKSASGSLIKFMSCMYESIQPYLGKIPDFTSLSTSDQFTLMERNIRNAGGYSGIVIFRDLDLYHNPVFTVGFPSIYGPALMNRALEIYEKTDFEDTLIKLLLPILIFSTGCDIVLPPQKKTIMGDNDAEQQEIRLLSNARLILKIQNFYVELLFKYMLYRFGHHEAVMRFTNLIKSAIDQISLSSTAREILIHQAIVQNVVEETERSLKV